MKLDKYIVHCDTKNKAKVFLDFCEKQGYIWYGNSTQWKDYKVETCYRIKDEVISYDSLTHYRDRFDRFYNYTIISFETFMKLYRHKIKSNKIERIFED